jgi:hypothetical protein
VRQAAILKLAVRLYHADTGQFPPSLNALPPGSVPDGLARSIGRGGFEYRLAADRLVADDSGWQTERIARGQPVVVARVPNWVALAGPVATAIPGSTGIEGDSTGGGAVLFPVPLPPKSSSKQ